MKSRQVVSFRPAEENKKRLELADRLGINISPILNEALATKLDKKIQERVKELRVVLEQVPA